MKGVKAHHVYPLKIKIKKNDTVLKWALLTQGRVYL